MSKYKSDIEIGYRAFEEVRRIFPEIKTACNRLPCAKNAIYGWHDGCTPGGLHLARLYYAGADIVYILTGKRGEMQDDRNRQRDH